MFLKLNDHLADKVSVIYSSLRKIQAIATALIVDDDKHVNCFLKYKVQL